MADLREQLRQEWIRSGLSLPELIKKSGIDCSVESMSRKLSGQQTLRLDEAVSLVRALGFELRLKSRKRAA